MRETLKYIKVLNWGYVGFAPITLSKDFEKSLQQAQERLELLNSLNYDALFVEAISANGKANLLKYQSTDDTIEYSLHFMRDRKNLLEMLKPDYWEKDKPEPVKNPKRLFRWAFDEIDKYKKDCVWTFEQWREYKWTLSEIEKGFEDRLRQFAAAYDYSLDGNDPNKSPKELATPEAKELINKAIAANLIEKTPEGLKWIGTKVLCAYFVDRASHSLNLSNKMDKEGNITTSWKPFEALFGIDGLKVAKQNWMRLYTKFVPTGYEKVDALF